MGVWQVADDRAWAAELQRQAAANRAEQLARRAQHNAAVEELKLTSSNHLRPSKALQIRAHACTLCGVQQTKVYERIPDFATVMAGQA